MLLAAGYQLPVLKEKTNFSWIKFPRPLETGKLHAVVVAASVSFLLAFDWEELGDFSGLKKRPVIGSTGRVSRGPPFRPITIIGGGGSTPALKRMRWTGSEGWAPTDNQYLQKTVGKNN